MAAMLLDRMAPRRETLALAFGTAVCLLGGLLPWCAIPSAGGSWIDADDVLHIVADECMPGIVGRTLLLMFGVASAALLIAGRGRAVRLRHLAEVVLVFLLLVPQFLLLFSPSSVRDAQIVYGHVDLTVTDMEMSLNQQQVDWRAWQDADMRVVGSAALADVNAELPSLDSLGWSNFNVIVDSVLGYGNAFLNLAGAGWYLAIVGLLCWLFGAYSGDPDAARRRSKGAAIAALLATAMLLTALAPRLLASRYVESARNSLALGDYRQAGLAFARADKLTPMRTLSIVSVAEEGEIEDQLMCGLCPAVVSGRVAAALASRRDFSSAASYLDRMKDAEPMPPGRAYWTSMANLLMGFERFNAGQYSAADIYFQRALRLVPIDALGWYGRSLAQTRLGHFDRAAHYLANASAIQHHLGFRRLTLQAQLHLMRAWAAFSDANLVLAHENYSRYLTPENW